MSSDIESPLFSDGDEVVGRKFGIGSSSKNQALLSSSSIASPNKRRASQRSPEIYRREAARDARQRKERAQSISDDDGSSDSSSEHDNSADEDFDVSPKKKTKLGKTAKVAPRSSIAKKKKSFIMPTMTSKEEGIIQADLSDILRQSQEENRARLAEMDRQLSMAAASQTSGSSTSDVPLEAKKLKSCPFCHESMPRRMSPALIEIMQYWLDQFHQKRRIGATATVEACQRHRNEAEIIPHGKVKGWKHTLNEDKLKNRIKNEKLPFIGIMRQRVEDPSTSDFFNKMVAERKRYGRQADSTSAQMQNMNEMQAGYYGERGWEILRNALINYFIDYPSSSKHDLNRTCAQLDGSHQRLSPHNFVERILIPELILMLIISDHTAKLGIISMDEAKKIRDESAEYGIAMFPSNAMGTVRIGSSAFGDQDSFLRSKKSTVAVGKDSPMGNGSKVSQKDNGKRILSASVQKSPRKSEGKATFSSRGKTAISKTPTPTPSTSQRVIPRPKPRSAAKSTNSEDFFALGTTIESSDESLVQLSQDMTGQDLNNPIVISPTKPPIDTVHFTDSSFDSTPKASQDTVSNNNRRSVSSSFDSPYWIQNSSTQNKDSRESLSQKEQVRQWRFSGSFPED